MLSDYIKKLKEIRKKAVSAQTLNSYVAVLSDLFINRIDLFTKTCSELGLTEEELLDILNNATLSNIGLLDEMININMDALKKVPGRQNKIGR
jgi:DNA phosphorothioation-dependent restriction protein DptG